MSSCCVDYDAPDVYNETWPKARKEHKCCECRKTINPGEKYQHIRMLWEGAWGTAKTCDACADLRDSLSEVWCPDIGGLRGAYQEYLDEAGKVRYDADRDVFVYPDNHMNLNCATKQDD